MLLAGDTLLPSAALVDYELTLSMPPRLTADTGTDSLTHAIEAFVSRRANPISDAFALAAMRTIWGELPASFHEPGNLKAREAMMVAATQAGLAFSNASVALVHGMSRPLGAHFHIPHGLSNAMLLPAVTAFSVEAAVERYAECARTMGLAQAQDPDHSAADHLIRGLYTRNAELQVPSPKQFGIAEERYTALIPTMAAQALASGSPQNNPRVPTAEEIEKIYQQAFQEWRSKRVGKDLPIPLLSAQTPAPSNRPGGTFCRGAESSEPATRDDLRSHPPRAVRLRKFRRPAAQREFFSSLSTRSPPNSEDPRRLSVTPLVTTSKASPS